MSAKQRTVIQTFLHYIIVLDKDSNWIENQKNDEFVFINVYETIVKILPNIRGIEKICNNLNARENRKRLVKKFMNFLSFVLETTLLHNRL